MKLNIKTTNKYGEVLTPISINGDIVLCVDESGETVNRNISCFEEVAHKKIENENVVYVTPFYEPEDVLLDEPQNKIIDNEQELLLVEDAVRKPIVKSGILIRLEGKVIER